MLVKVLKPFPHAADGMTVVTHAEGAVVDIAADLVEGLHDEGFVDEASEEDLEAAQSGAVVIPDAVEIPADWQALHWFKLKALAERVNGAPVKDKAAAVAVIHAELDKRG